MYVLFKRNKFADIVRYCTASCVLAVLLFFYASFAKTSHIAVMSFSDSVTSFENAPVTVGAQACIMIDARSGAVLYSKNHNTRLPMASTTKIMTALVALENADPEMNVTVTADSVGVEGSSIYLKEGETLTLKELLYGLMLESGNDAASAIAVAVSGNEEGFVKLMNEKAELLGLRDTHFDNPHGLTSETHYTTACELAKITAEAMKNETFRMIVATEKYVVPERDLCSAKYFFNHNRLLRAMKSCDGGKTGYTAAAGRCLVTSTTDGDSTFIVVTLNDRNDWNDHRALHEYALENYKTISVADAKELKFVTLTHGTPKIKYTICNTDELCFTALKNAEYAPIFSVKFFEGDFALGDVAGCAELCVSDTVYSYPLHVVEKTDVRI